MATRPRLREKGGAKEAKLPIRNGQFPGSNKLWPEWQDTQASSVGADDPGRLMKTYPFDDDGAVLDLVAHFLGIATHDNVNAPPSCLLPTADPGKAAPAAPEIALPDDAGHVRLPFRQVCPREPLAQTDPPGPAR